MASAPPTSDVRPGTRFFAPQARLVTPTGGALMIDGQPISQDITSLTITQSCNGVGQVDVTLNNQRFDGHRIPTPLWRYNGLRNSQIAFGTRFRIDMRYGQDGWTPMMLARVTDIAFAFPPAAGSTVTVKAEDLLSVLKIKPPAEVPHSASHEADMVTTEVSNSGCGLELVLPSPANLFSAPLAAMTHQTSQSYLQFIQGFADRMDYEVFVDFDDPGTPLSGSGPANLTPKLHFIPARSGTLGDPIPLAGGLDVIDFKPTLKVWELLTEAKVTGNVPRGRGAIDVTVAMADAITGDLHAAPDGGATPISAEAVRHRAFETEVAFNTRMSGPQIEKNVTTINATNIDEERATMQGKAALRKSAREFLTATIKTIGYARLRPGIHINLTGYYAPFDGIYYVTQAVHALSAEGYTTTITVRRPGMLDPADYPEAGG